MAIKSVSCPKCNASMNVAASMASTKCQACGNIFPVSGLAASRTATNAPASSSAKTRKAGNSSKSGGNLGHWLIAGGVTALAILGLLAITFFRVGADPEPGPENEGPPMRTDATVVEELQQQTGDGEIEFRVVNLPESTRKSIYRDHKKMIGSSFGKAKKIPKSGVAGQSLNRLFGDVVDNEVKKLAIIHGISEDDYAQIIAEGDAEQWK